MVVEAHKRVSAIYRNAYSGYGIVNFLQRKLIRLESNGGEQII